MKGGTQLEIECHVKEFQKSKTLANGAL